MYEIDPKDLRIDSYTSKPTGSWKVGMMTGIKITHLPSGIEVCVDSERSQYKNRNLAIQDLKEKLKDFVPPESPHPDDHAVDRFAEAMKAKLKVSREKGRGGWNDPHQCSVEYLAKLLVEHVAKGDSVDVGNLAMMLYQRCASHSVLSQAMYNYIEDRLQKKFQEGFEAGIAQIRWEQGC